MKVLRLLATFLMGGILLGKATCSDIDTLRYNHVFASSELVLEFAPVTAEMDEEDSGFFALTCEDFIHTHLIIGPHEVLKVNVGLTGQLRECTNQFSSQNKDCLLVGIRATIQAKRQEGEPLDLNVFHHSLRLLFESKSTDLLVRLGQSSSPYFDTLHSIEPLISSNSMYQNDKKSADQTEERSQTNDSLNSVIVTFVVLLSAGVVVILGFAIPMIRNREKSLVQPPPFATVVNDSHFKLIDEDVQRIYETDRLTPGATTWERPGFGTDDHDVLARGWRAKEGLDTSDTDEDDVDSVRSMKSVALSDEELTGSSYDGDDDKDHPRWMLGRSSYASQRIDHYFVHVPQTTNSDAASLSSFSNSSAEGSSDDSECCVEPPTIPQPGENFIVQAPNDDDDEGDAVSALETDSWSQTSKTKPSIGDFQSMRADIYKSETLEI